MTQIGINFPQSREARREKLQEIKRSGTPIGTVKVPGRGIQKVYKIPLEYLSYNPYNTRFLAQAKTFEKRMGRELDDAYAEDVKKIEQFIWEEKKDKNESTIDSLIKDGQLNPGVVTIEGVILSGNRRFRLLNEISRNHDKYGGSRINLDGLDFFEAAILEDELSKKDIVRYESFYQYGTEDKADYDPIQKYIAAAMQKEMGFNEEEIAENFKTMTDGSPNKVKKWIEIFDLMKDYLEYIGEEGIYTALEGTEEAFIRLDADYNSLKNGRSANSVDWAFDDIDLDNLKCRFFDYIRIGFGTHDVRDLKKVFQTETYWKEINEKIEDGLKDIAPLQKYREKYTDSDEAQLSRIRSKDYQELNGKVLGNVYREIKATLSDREVEETPIKITEQILQKIDKLEGIVFAEGAAHDENFIDNIRNIQSRIGKIKQQID